jgi:hypothetical protein
MKLTSALSPSTSFPHVPCTDPLALPAPCLVRALPCTIASLYLHVVLSPACVRATSGPIAPHGFQSPRTLQRTHNASSLAR